MGLFGNHYERAGSGISKNAPKKKGIFRFFEIFGRKFWKLFELNLLYFLSFLPVIGAVALFFAVDSRAGNHSGGGMSGVVCGDHRSGNGGTYENSEKFHHGKAYVSGT